MLRPANVDYDQAPPASLEIEKALLGAILIDPSVLPDVLRILQPRDFLNEGYAKILAHMAAMLNGGGGAVDVLLLAERLRQAVELEEVGGEAHLAEIVSCVPHAANAVYYAGIVREKARLRNLIDTGSRLAQDAFAGRVSAGDLAKVARANLMLTAEDAKSVRFDPMTCADLVDAQFDVRFLVDQILVAGQPFLLAGPQKSLKTTVLVDLAFSLATAGYFLGKFPVPEAVTVGLMTGESGLATIQETVRRVASAAHRDPVDVQNLLILDRVPQFSSPEHLDAVRSLVMDHAIEVLIVDPCYMAMDGADAGNLFVQGQLLRGISELCQEHGVTLVLCHHTKKAAGTGYEPLELSSIAWAGFAEFARQWLLINRREAYQPGAGSHRLWMNVGGSTGHGGLWGLDIEEGVYTGDGGRFWDVTVMDAADIQDAKQHEVEGAKEAERERQCEQDKQSIVNAMAKHPAGETQTVIRDTAALHDRRFKPAFAELIQAKDVVSCEVVKSNRKKPYPGYKLAPRE